MSCDVREAAAPQYYLKQSRDFEKLDEKFSFPFTNIRTRLLLLNFSKVDGGRTSRSGVADISVKKREGRRQ